MFAKKPQSITTTVRISALAAAIALGSQASADSYGPVGFGPGGVYAFNLASLYRGLDQRIPYFAAHPPVYYSYPVPRTYGYSPFAYPPNARTPDLGIATGPKTILNPYVEQRVTPQADAGSSTVLRPGKSVTQRMVKSDRSVDLRIWPISGEFPETSN